MSRYKERVFRFRKYCPYEVTPLHPEELSPDECKQILSNHIGTNSTFFIEEATRTSEIISPQILFDTKKKDPTAQQEFLDTKASSIKGARRVFLKESTLPLYKN